MVGRLDVADLAEELSRLYGEVELQLAAGVAKRLAAGIDDPDWATRKLAAAGEVRRWVDGLAKRLANSANPRLRRAIRKAFERGGDAAQRELAGVSRRRTELSTVRTELPGAQNIDRLATALAGRVDAAGLQVARSAVDAYREVVTAASASVLGGVQARREAAQTAWNRALDQGLTAFTDRAGRRWTLAGYLEMATRTTTAQAAVAGQLDRAAQLGIDLVIVSNAPQECPRCRPWEGKILTRDERGRGGATLEVEHATDDRMIKVRVSGSVAEAVAAGLLHPNCRHSLSAYMPGITVAPTTTADPAGDKARQQLRALERRVRAERLKEAAALTPEAKRAAADKAKALQAQIRQHVKANDLTRRPDRERPDLGNKRTPPPASPATAPEPPTPPEPEPPRYERAQAQLRADVDSGIKRSEQLGGGETARVDRLYLNNGSSAVRKIARDSAGRPAVDQQDAEELSALVADAIGAPAPAVIRQSKDVVDMVHVEGPTWFELEMVQDVKPLKALEDGRQLALLDELIGNFDRNPGNIIVQGERLHGIDHGAAFDWHHEYNPPERPSAMMSDIRHHMIIDDFPSNRFRPDALRPGEADQLREQLEALRPEFARLGREVWLNNSLRRLRAIEQAGEGS